MAFVDKCLFLFMTIGICRHVEGLRCISCSGGAGSDDCSGTCETDGQCYFRKHMGGSSYGCVHGTSPTPDFHVGGCAYYRSDPGALWCLCGGKDFCNSPNTRNNTISNRTERFVKTFELGSDVHFRTRRIINGRFLSLNGRHLSRSLRQNTETPEVTRSLFTSSNGHDAAGLTTNKLFNFHHRQRTPSRPSNIMLVSQPQVIITNTKGHTRPLITTFSPIKNTTGFATGRINDTVLNSTRHHRSRNAVHFNLNRLIFLYFPSLLSSKARSGNPDYDVIDLGPGCGTIYGTYNKESPPEKLLLNDPCPWNYEYHTRRHSCYKFVDELESHSGAEDVCGRQGAHLASLESFQEYMCVSTRLKMIPGSSSDWRGWWTSGKYDVITREFMWSYRDHVISRRDRRWLAPLLRPPYENTCVWLVPGALLHFGNYACQQSSRFICEINL